MGGEGLLLTAPPVSSAMASHRGGHLVLGAQEAGGTGGLRMQQDDFAGRQPAGTSDATHNDYGSNHGEAHTTSTYMYDVDERIAAGAAWRPEIQEEPNGEVIGSRTAPGSNGANPEKTRFAGISADRRVARATEVIVHYAVPEGQRYLPIALGQTVTMVAVGRHYDHHVYEPVNTWLQSPEDGLRYHRSMNDQDVYTGPLDMATFGRPVSGPLSDDKKWLVHSSKLRSDQTFAAQK